MSTRKLFHEFIQVKRIREGLWVDGKMLTVNLDLVVGPFTFANVTYKWATGSIRLGAGRFVHLKQTYHVTLKKIITDAIDKRRRSSYSEEVGVNRHGASE